MVVDQQRLYETNHTCQGCEQRTPQEVMDARWNDDANPGIVF